MRILSSDVVSEASVDTVAEQEAEDAKERMRGDEKA